MISRDDARDAAERYLLQSTKEFRYKFVNAELRDDEYSCLFGLYTFDGYEIDCPIIVNVNCHTGEVKPQSW